MGGTEPTLLKPHLTYVKLQQSSVLFKESRVGMAGGDELLELIAVFLARPRRHLDFETVLVPELPFEVLDGAHALKASSHHDHLGKNSF